ncbi:MAG: nitrate reductase molybdenum cofactor assembly chaperone [Desulfurococcales archaeon]|nr:nitrate reductase molybdenum cofactor assembly chaperone [Desulfurococcales archaeon]
MRLALRVLSILFDYPSKEFESLIREADTVLEALYAENPKIARHVEKFIRSVNGEDAEELFVSIFEMPARCSLYLHEYLLKGKEEELGRFLLELKGRYRLRGFDMDTRKELPDYLPVVLEFLSLAPDEDLRLFAKRYLAPFLPKLETCLSRKGGERYVALVKALEELVEPIVK